MMIQATSSSEDYDVVIVGGGPAGSTCGSLLRKYNQNMRVLILEKEKFPRDHVGESQLPGISAILEDMGSWDAVEAAGFPVKIGATYTWGQSKQRWDFDFFPVAKWVDEPRPAKYEGQRKATAFQVDRAIYDDILLRHAEKLGAEVREETKVVKVHREDDRITGLELDSGEIVTARHCVDCSGTVGLIRRAMGVESDAPKELRNIAIWDYWTNADWAVEIGVGATRVQVRSLPYGWIWFIPLGPTRTSIGLICPADYYKESNMSPEELYLRALKEQEEIAGLLDNAERRGMVETAKDWSHLAHRLVGENWFLAGESGGFADPILAAGMTLAQGSAHDLAYTLLEMEHNEIDPEWLKARYNERHRKNIDQHIRFAQYWYSANGCFSDLQEHCQRIAKEAGLKLSPQKAWQWLSQGGFHIQNATAPGAGSFDVTTAKEVVAALGGVDQPIVPMWEGYNQFKLNLRNAKEDWLGQPHEGRIHRIPCYVRGAYTLPRVGYFGAVIDALHKTTDVSEMVKLLKQESLRAFGPANDAFFYRYLQSLDTMIQHGWVERRKRKDRPFLTGSDSEKSFQTIHYGQEVQDSLKKVGRSDLLKSRIDQSQLQD